MDRYIGIDAHKESCTLAVMGPTGRRIQEQRLETNAKAMKEALKALSGQRHVCLEEGELSAWLYEICEPLAKRVVVIQAAKKQGPKSDSIDAWSLADQMRRGESDRFVFNQLGTYRPLREAVRCYDGMVLDSVRIKNRFGAVFRARGIKVRSQEIYSGSSRSKWLAKLKKMLMRHIPIIPISLFIFATNTVSAKLYH